MADSVSLFLESVLGVDAAASVTKSEDVAEVAVPRAVWAWVQAQTDYDGPVPGVDGSWARLRKSDSGYDGFVYDNDSEFRLESASTVQAAAAIAVTLGLNSGFSIPNPKLIQRLGKTLDTLVKSQSLIKAISQIPGSDTGDYSHVLSPRQREKGYSLHLKHNPESGTLTMDLRHGRALVGGAKAVHEPETGTLHLEDTEIAESHRGQGLGQALYEGLMAHGLHKLGAKNVAGAVHSTSASKVHSALAQRHGLEYKPTPTPFPKLAGPKGSDYDARHGPYQYALKAEFGGTPRSGTDHHESPGPHAKPWGHQEPEPPQAQEQNRPRPAPAKPINIKPVTAPPKTLAQTRDLKTKTKAQKQLRLGVQKSQTRARCPVCGKAQFLDFDFVGCYCFQDLAKSVTVTRLGTGSLILDFDANSWDTDSILTLRESLRDETAVVDE